MLKNVLIIIAITIISVELVLRAQQAMGPIYDLSLSDTEQALASISHTLNHIPLKKSIVEYQPREVYGELAGQTLTRIRHPNSLRNNKLRTENPELPNILFLGDSFMEGYDDANTLPQLIWANLNKDSGPRFNAWNVGHSSYSPAIFSVQVRELIPALRPDVVIIDVDETDLADDLARYEPLATIGKDGCISAIAPSPPRVRWLEGLNEANRHSLYILRFLQKFMITRVIVPRLSHDEREKNFPADLNHILAYADSEDARQSEGKAAKVFTRNLECMLSHLEEYVDKKNILFVRHPHRYHLETGPNGYKWRSPAHENVLLVAKSFGLRVHDSEVFFQQIAQKAPVKSFYWGGGDMHFNFTGMRHYSDYLSEVVLEHLDQYFPIIDNRVNKAE